MKSKDVPAHPATQLVLGGRDRDTLGFVNPPLVRAALAAGDLVRVRQLKRDVINRPRRRHKWRVVGISLAAKESPYEQHYTSMT